MGRKVKIIVKDIDKDFEIIEIDKNKLKEIAKGKKYSVSDLFHDENLEEDVKMYLKVIRIGSYLKDEEFYYNGELDYNITIFFPDYTERAFGKAYFYKQKRKGWNKYFKKRSRYRKEEIEFNDDELFKKNVSFEYIDVLDSDLEMIKSKVVCQERKLEYKNLKNIAKENCYFIPKRLLVDDFTSKKGYDILLFKLDDEYGKFKDYNLRILKDQCNDLLEGFGVELYLDRYDTFLEKKGCKRIKLDSNNIKPLFSTISEYIGKKKLSLYKFTSWEKKRVLGLIDLDTNNELFIGYDVGKKVACIKELFGNKASENHHNLSNKNLIKLCDFNGDSLLEKINNFEELKTYLGVLAHYKNKINLLINDEKKWNEYTDNLINLNNKYTSKKININNNIVDIISEEKKKAKSLFNQYLIELNERFNSIFGLNNELKYEDYIEDISEKYKFIFNQKEDEDLDYEKN